MKKIVFVCLLACSMAVNAQNIVPVGDVLVNPAKMSDSFRALVGSILNLLKLGEEPEIGAVLNVTQEEVDALVAGDETYEEDVGTGEAGPGLATPTFDYINTNVLTNKLKTPYEPLNRKLSGKADYKKIVKEMFFIATDKEATEKKQQEVLSTRTAYMTELGKSYTRLAYNVHQQLIDDMTSISADINGNGSIGATAGMDQTWHAINRALIADIALQIQLMELDAVKFLSVQPLVLMTETQPSSTGNNGGNGS